MHTPHRLTAREITSLVGGELLGPSDIQLTGVAPLYRAGPTQLSFLASSRYLQYFQHTSAGAVLVGPEFRSVPGGPATRIIVPDAQHAVAALLRTWYAPPPPGWGVHPTARIGRNTRWLGRVAFGAGAVVGSDVLLGHDCRVDAFAVVGDGCRLADGCQVDAHATLHPGTELGAGVRVRAGARVGGDGFGFASQPSGHQRLPHVGRCVLAEGVDVGCNSTIDRGSIDDTVVGPGTKVDAQVHIAHNVRVGGRCLIMAQVGIAGSSQIEDDVVIAGQAGLSGHLRVGAGARIAAQAGIIGDVSPGVTVSGYPARPHREVLRQTAALKRIAPLVDRLEEIALRHDR